MSSTSRNSDTISRTGRTLTPLSQPLPFVAYPFLVATLFGWAWVHYRDAV